MKPKILSVLIAGLFVPALAQGQEPQKEVTGSISIGVREVRNNTNDPSKFTEYRDLPTGTSITGGIELRQRGDENYMNIYGENIGRDDQYLNLDGGRYGNYKYRLYSDSLRHNLGSGPGARTPFFGAGGETLNYPGTVPNQNPATWNTFDHSYRRLNQGGFFELQKTSPWYFRVDANEVKREGTNVFAGAKGTSPGNGFMDLPAPIDYTTRNLSGEVGFSNKTSHVAVNLMRSSFDNGHSVLNWQNDFFGGMDKTILPPSNELTRLGINGNLRGLGLDSTVAGRYTYTTVTSDTSMQQTMLGAGGANIATNPSDANFHGDHKRQTLGLSLASRPTKELDTRIYYNWDKLENNSTEITFNTAANALACSAANCVPDQFHYTKQNMGVEGGYRLSQANKLLGGLDYTHTDRERADFPKTKESRIFGEWKSEFTDTLSGRIKYQYMKRVSDFQFDPSENPMDQYVRRFDLANMNQNLIKLVLDQSFVSGVDVGFEMLLKNNHYPDTILGRTKDDRQEFYGSVGWGDPKVLRFLVFGDLEYVKYDSNHRVDSNGSGNPNPATPPTATAYNWSARNKDNSWQIGAGADWAATPRLKVKTSILYAETNGNADFSAQSGVPGNPTFVPITNFDNTKRFSFVARGVYDVTKAVEVSGGYSYENYKYSDIGYDNTKYIAGTGTGASYVTGQFSFQPYSVNLFFGTVKLKF